MKKILTIIVVLGLACAANAEWLDDYESYTPPDPVAGTNGWLAGGIGAGDWWLVGSNTLGQGINGGTCTGGTGSPSLGDHKNVSISSGTVTINALFNIVASAARGSFGLGQEAYGTGAWPGEGVLVDYQAGWHMNNIVGGGYTASGSSANPDTWGWHEIELSVNMDDNSAYAKIRNVDNTTGAPTTAWTQFGTIAAGNVSSNAIQYVGVGHKFGMLVDGLGVPTIPPIDGDVDGDGFVSGVDTTIITTNWGLSPAQRSDGDLDDNDAVGASDYQLVLDNWGEGTPSEPAEAPGATPEPSTLLLLLGGLALLRRRRSA